MVLMIFGLIVSVRASPEIRSQFAKSLPAEILCELVITLSDLPAGPIIHPQPQHPVALPAPHHIQELEPPRPNNKRSRKTDVGPLPGPDDAFEVKPIKKQARKSEPSRRQTNNSRSVALDPIPLTPEKELDFCRDLIVRMTSGPGYWTRLVAHFKHPVDPVAANMPNYFAVVKRPMDLMTIRGKMERGEYSRSEEFLADIRQIFQNCYEYWTNEDSVFKDCEKLEKYFGEQWQDRFKWSGPKIKAEVID